MLSQERKRRNRDRFGQMLKEARTDLKLTQKELADNLGLEYHSMVSQMELGYISIPPTLWLPLSENLKFNPSDFAIRCLNEYYPELYKALFQKRGRDEAVALLYLFANGQLDDAIRAHLKGT